MPSFTTLRVYSGCTQVSKDQTGSTRAWIGSNELPIATANPTETTLVESQADHRVGSSLQP